MSDPTSGNLKIEAWLWYELLDDVVIEGSATCDLGKAQIRLYAGGGEETRFLRIAWGYIEGHALRSSVTNVSNPKSLLIKYSFDPDF